MPKFKPTPVKMMRRSLKNIDANEFEKDLLAVDWNCITQLENVDEMGGWQVVCACRVLQGLSQGFLFPATHSLLGQWAPLEEKSSLGTLAYSGCQIGMALQNLCSGFIASAWGWPAIFYANGAIGALWVAAYVFLGASSPAESTVISVEEKQYIENSLGHVGVQKVCGTLILRLFHTDTKNTIGVIGALWVAAYVFLGASSPAESTVISVEEKQYIENSLGHVGVQKKYKTPWKSIWTSIPFLSLMIAHGGQNWGFFTMATLIPTYMANVLGADIKQNGVLSALPYFTVFLMSFPVGFTADWILKRNLLSVTNTRKLFNSIGLYGAGLALIGLSYTPPGYITMAVVLLMAVVGINAGHYAGYMLVHIDMAPNFAGTLMGITNCFANIISLIAPLAAGAMLNDETDPNEWRKVFYTASAIYIAANSIFVAFGSCEKQKWNEPDDGTMNTTDEKTEKHV
ncbi:major facilitator superfamily domain-containing protein [Phthorimaea operculella]|nr:major facilitator superfamily domain-containing protein [Phthorimaea operculella]